MRRAFVPVFAFAVLSSLTVLAPPAHAASVTIDFETPDLSGAETESTDYSSYESQGIHIDNGAFGIVEGVSQGDDGNWDLEGTDGPQFLGNNDDNDYTIVITLDLPRRSMSIDCSRSGGSAEGDSMTVTLKSGSTEVDTSTQDFGTINTWSTFSYSGATSFDTIVLQSHGASFHPYGCDKLVLSEEELPGTGADPGPLLLLGAAFLAVGILFRVGRRRLA